MPEIVIKSETQKVAEAKVDGFRSDLGPFVVAAETTRMAMLFTDAKEPGNPIIFANDAFLDLSGYDREEVLGQSFNFLMARGTDPDSLARIDIAFAGTPKGGSEICCRRKDGDKFWSAILISPVRDESGDVVQHFASLHRPIKRCPYCPTRRIASVDHLPDTSPTGLTRRGALRRCVSIRGK
jgi:PAS domain S-box-containing protein